MSGPPERAPAATGAAGGSPPRSWRQLCFLSAIGLIVGATIILPRVSPVARDPLQPPAFGTARWWMTPIELGAARRLPRVDADLLAVAAAPDGKQVLAGGRHGTLLASDDGGVTWRPERVLVREPLPPAGPEPAPAKPAKTEEEKQPSKGPAADDRLAAAEEKKKKAAREEARRRRDEEAKRRAAEALGRADDGGKGGRGGVTPLPLDRPTLREPSVPAAKPAAPADTPPPPPEPPPRPDKPEKVKEGKGETKAGLDIFRWLVPEAHAAAPPPAEAPPAAVPVPVPQAPPPPAGLRETFVATDDDIVWVGTDGTTWRALTSSATSVQRGADGNWTPGPPSAAGEELRTFVAGARLIASGGPGGSYFVLSTGDIARSDRLRGAHLERARAIATTRDGKRVLALADSAIWGMPDSGFTPGAVQGAAWERVAANAAVPLRGLHFADVEHGWVVGESAATGELFRTEDGGAHWTASATKAPVPLNGVFFLDDGKHGWVVGNDGYIATTDDGGETLVSRTRPRTLKPAGTPWTFPAPWYLTSWLFAFGLFFVGRSIPAAKEAKTTRAVMQAFTSDRPLEKGDPDVLKLSELASGLSRFLRNEATKPPLTVAITGPWGTGKSSLMNLLRADLRSFGFNPVWFNAWHHQKEEHLLASLLQAIRNQAIPAIWRPEGLMFRAHLLLIRARKHALTILILLFVCGSLLGSTLSSGSDFEDVHKLLDTLKGWADYLLNPSATKPNASPLDQLAGLGLSHLPGIGALATLIVSLFRGLRAFGLNPGALLASNATSSKLADLDAQSSFRDKFRAEYRDVSEALGVRTLLIFIDDLDRCQPEQVLDVLEAVNYLVTSGDCFVILGVDRSRVEPCVALGFKEISAEISGKDDRDHRQQYAVQYLDKLINIEVPIPSLDPSEARALLVLDGGEGAAHATPAGDGKRPASRLGKTLAELRDILRPTFRLWPFAIAAAAFMAGFGGFSTKHTGEKKPAAAARAVANAVQPGGPEAPPIAKRAPALGTATVQDTPNGQGSESEPVPVTGEVAPLLSDVATAIDQEVRNRDPQRGQFEAGLPEVTLIGSLFWLFVVVWSGFVLVQIVRSRPELVVKDSDEFVEAWRAWSPIVFSQAKTPRALKRFQNRVRFLSMRQQASAGADERGWAQRLRDRVLGRRNETDDRKPAPSSPDEQPIPDAVLVELAAIHLYRRNLFEGTSDAAALAGDRDLEDIADAIASASDDPGVRSSKDWRWHPSAVASDIVTYREPFLARQSGVRTH
jgi:hypothetical protein